MRSSDALLREFHEIRANRDQLRVQRAQLFCARAEPVSPIDYADANAELQADPLSTFEFPQPTQAEPCWKAARKWEDTGYRARFYLDPPMEQWCGPCQERQRVSDMYREAVRRHGGALRGLLRRGKALSAADGKE